MASVKMDVLNVIYCMVGELKQYGAATTKV